VLGGGESVANLIQGEMSYVTRVKLLLIKMATKQTVHMVVKKGQHVVGPPEELDESIQMRLDKQTYRGAVVYKTEIFLHHGCIVDHIQTLTFTFFMAE